MRRLIASVVATGVLLAGCGSAHPPELEDIRGIWVLETFGVVGNPAQDVESGVDTYWTPWMQIDTDIHGHLGCNEFSIAVFELREDQLIVGGDGLFSTLADCLGAQGAEDAVRGVLLGRATVEVDGSTMRLTATDAHNVTNRLVFRAVDRPPGS